MEVTRTHLVEADTLEFATDIDPGRTDAEDALLLQPALSMHCPYGHGCRQSRGHHNSDDVQGTYHDLEGWSLIEKQPGPDELMLPHRITKVHRGLTPNLTNVTMLYVIPRAAMQVRKRMNFMASW